MAITIRPATRDDYSTLKELNRKCGEEPKWLNFIPDTVENTYIPLQKIDPTLVLIAEINEKAVGYLTADEYDQEKGVVAIETVFVLAEYRRQGIGTQLVDYFTSIWIDQNQFSVHLYAVGYDSFQFFNQFGWEFKWAMMKKTPS